MSVEDESTLVQTYLRWRAPLLRLLSRKLGSRSDAEDLVQESFARWLAQGAARPIARPQAYVLQIAIHALGERAYARGGRPALPPSPGQQPADGMLPSAQEHAEYRQLLGRVNDAIAELPENPRRAFLLHRLERWSRQRIAAELGVSERMVSKYIAQALAHCQLRVDYGEDAPAPGRRRKDT